MRDIEFEIVRDLVAYEINWDSFYALKEIKKMADLALENIDAML